MVSNRTLAMVKRRVNTFLTDTCTILRPSAGFDDYGNSQDGETTVATDVPCRLLPIQERDNTEMVGGVEAGRVYYRVILPYNTDIKDNDVLEVAGERYEGLQVEEAHTDKVDVRARVSKLGV